MSIKKQAFTLALLPPPPIPGEQVWLGTSATTIYSFVVPEGVYAISAVCVSLRAGGTNRVPSIKRGATVLLSAASTLGADGVGGGNGGAKGANGAYYGGGGGGAGGYSGNGGQGGGGRDTVGWAGYSGNPGGGGGGGGGAGGDTGNPSFPNSYGGAVGLLGQGANGAAGVANAGSPVGFGGIGSNPGSSAIAGAGLGDAGGDLRWKNDIPVTPGETLTVYTAYNAGANVYGYNTGVRIMWGGTRSYPDDAGDAIPQGQAVIALANTTWTVPAGVTSISACAQQQDGSKAAVSLVVSGTTVLRAQNGARIGDGGGDGGAAGSGGGGGGGYAGDGGDGGDSVYNPDGTYSGRGGGDGTGGGGAGGYGMSSRWVQDPVWGGSSGSGQHLEYTAARPGGGVGISGQGASGTGASPNGSHDPINGYMGAGPAGVAGGALAWKNAVAVTPGQVITVNAAGGRIRIIWGPGRSYPTTAGNV